MFGVKKYADCIDPPVLPAPVLPNNASWWKAWHAEEIGIFYLSEKVEQDKWRQVLKDKIDCSLSTWATMVKAFRDLMDEIPYNPSMSSRSRLIEILNTDRAAQGKQEEGDPADPARMAGHHARARDPDDVEFVKAEREALLKACMELRLEFSPVVKEMARKTNISEISLKNLL
jgi:hypothetical protein